MAYMRLTAGAAHNGHEWYECPWKMIRSWGVSCAPLRDRSAPYKFQRIDGDLYCLYRVEPWYPYLNLYDAMAEHLELADASEIYLPTEIAKSTPLVVIEALQKNVPKKLLQDKFTAVRGSDFQFRLRA